MASKKFWWIIYGSLLVAAAPTITQAADKAAAPDANQILCRNLDRPGSRVKDRTCATLAEWSTIQRDRALRDNVAAANPAVSIGAISATSGTTISGFGTGASQSSFQR